MSNNEQLSIEELITSETEKRIAEMSKADYAFPAKINKADILAMVVSVVGSMALILLCMTGVIK